MSLAKPELIFVAGPRAGQRAVLMSSVSCLGRSQQAEVRVDEPCVSRRQLLFTMTRDGCVVENISTTNKIRINGKKYKAGKKMILASGDLLGVGADTQLLFVEAQDNPHAVLEAYREKFPAQAVAPPAETSVEPPATQRLNIAPPPEPSQANGQHKADDKTMVDRDGDDSGKKHRKYLIGFAIYMLVLAGLFAALLAWRGGKNGQANSYEQVAWLTSEDIDQAIASDLRRSPNIEASARSLRIAREMFLNRQRLHEKGNLYRCVKNYRLYLAFRRKNRRVFTPKDERQYDIAKQELAGQLLEIYKNARVAYGAGRWADARDELEALLKYLPVKETEKDPQVRQVIVENTLAHLRLISKKRTQQK